MTAASSWSGLDVEVRLVAERVLTPRQLRVFVLDLGGLSTRRIALALNVSRWSVRDHLDAAHDKLRRQGVVFDPVSGVWRVGL